MIAELFGMCVVVGFGFDLSGVALFYTFDWIVGIDGYLLLLSWFCS